MPKSKQAMQIYNRPVVDLHRLRENEQCAHLCDNEQCAHLCDNEQFTQYAKKQTGDANLQQACCRFASPARK